MATDESILTARFWSHFDAKRQRWLLGAMVAVALPALIGWLSRRVDFALAMALFLLAAGLILANRRLAVPLAILALPLEISKLWFPLLPTRAELGGGLPPTSIIDLGRLLMALVILLGLGEVLQARRLRLTALQLSSSVLLAVFTLSILYTRSRQDAIIETVRLAFFVLFFLTAPALVPDRRTLAWCLVAFLSSATAVALIALYQGLSGRLFWNTGLLEYGQYRVNAVFGDPNHLARFLVEALGISLAVLAAWRDKRWLLVLSTVLLAPPALLFTGSRAGWLLALLVMPLTAAFLPRAHLSRRGLGLLAIGVTLVTLAVALSMGPYLSGRLRSLGSIAELLGPRSYLVRAGGAMFHDHPLTGVGLGAFQDTLQTDYAHFIDVSAGPVTTLSHTAAVTIAAELGLIGLAAFVLFLGGWAKLVWETYRIADQASRPLLIGLTAAGVTILLASQSAGRLFEDPYLWVILGLTVAMRWQA